MNVSRSMKRLYAKFLNGFNAGKSGGRKRIGKRKSARYRLPDSWIVRQIARRIRAKRRGAN